MLVGAKDVKCDMKCLRLLNDCLKLLNVIEDRTLSFKKQLLQYFNDLNYQQLSIINYQLPTTTYSTLNNP